MAGTMSTMKGSALPASRFGAANVVRAVGPARASRAGRALGLAVANAVKFNYDTKVFQKELVKFADTEEYIYRCLQGSQQEGYQAGSAGWRCTAAALWACPIAAGGSRAEPLAQHAHAAGRASADDPPPPSTPARPGAAATSSASCRRRSRASSRSASSGGARRPPRRRRT